VTFPPGRARLPVFCASAPPPITTMGTVGVTRCATPAVVPFGTTSTATWSWTTSSTRVAKRSRLPSAQRHSMVRFWPSTHPSSRNPCPNAATMGGSAEAGGLGLKPKEGNPRACGWRRGAERHHDETEGEGDEEPDGAADHRSVPHSAEQR
jgi:hypothetical protein